MANGIIVLVTKDLFFVPTLRTAAERLGGQVVVALSADSDKLTGLSSASGTVAGPPEDPMKVTAEGPMKVTAEGPMKGSAENSAASSTGSTEVTAWVIDLSSVSVADIPSSVQLLTDRFPQAHKIAFGPHVQAQRLAAAEQAGCQQVLSRGQISSQIDRLMGQWLG